MASDIQSDGKTVTVTTDEGHRIGFRMAELNAPSVSGEITTEWAGGVPPNNPETTVRAAKTQAEQYVARHEPSAPADAQASKEANKSLGDKVKAGLGLP